MKKNPCKFESLTKMSMSLNKISINANLVTCVAVFFALIVTVLFDFANTFTVFLTFRVNAPAGQSGEHITFLLRPTSFHNLSLDIN